MPASLGCYGLSRSENRVLESITIVWELLHQCRYSTSTTGTHWNGGWAGLRAGLYAVEKTNSLLLPGIELRSFQPVALRLTDRPP
jgi:hypothetical protein